jgi:hypothetical protein
MTAMTNPTTYRGRRAVSVENSRHRVTVLVEGGHIAEVFDKAAGVNPLWTPPWPSMEPSRFDATRDVLYGDTIESKLLAGLMGHNLCLDIFGGPSEAEAAAGLPVHGEASIVAYDIQQGPENLTMRAALPLAGLQVERQIQLRDGGVRIRESVLNTGGTDKPIGWTQHVTLGPPFLERGKTEFRASLTKSRVFESTFGPADYLRPAAEFDWPDAPGLTGGTRDLRRYTDAAVSSAYTAHLVDPFHTHGFFVAFSPGIGLAFGCVWRRDDFPWLGIWEENSSRTHAPWNGRTLTRGMEFGVSPFPETRRAMVERGRLFDTPSFRWIAAGSRVSVEYWYVSTAAEAVPETLEWPE